MAASGERKDNRKVSGKILAPASGRIPVESCRRSLVQGDAVSVIGATREPASKPQNGAGEHRNKHRSGGATVKGVGSPFLSEGTGAAAKAYRTLTGFR